MKIVPDIQTLPYFSSRLTDRYLGNMRMGIFDIETLGLNPASCPVVLAGLAVPEPDGTYHVYQYFAEDPCEESYVLECIRNDFSRLDFVLTYNGRHFDLPFIQKRSSILGVRCPECNLYDLDLYLVLNGYSQIKYMLRNLKQKTVEEYMGLSDSRDDMISGADSVKMYKDFLRCSDPLLKSSLEEKILLHNHDDLVQLYRLMPVLKQVDIHRAFSGLGFPVSAISGWPSLTVSAVKVSPQGITVSGFYPGDTFSYISYGLPADSFFCEFSEDGRFVFKLHTDRHKGNIFVNLQSYFDSWDEFKVYPNYINGFLLVSDGRSVNNLELNMFTKCFLQKFMEDALCPLAVL